MIEKRHEGGLKPEHAYSRVRQHQPVAPGLGNPSEGGQGRDRPGGPVGIFIGHWRPTFYGPGNALRSFEEPRRPAHAAAGITASRRAHRTVGQQEDR
jgi:hypothetical protein